MASWFEQRLSSNHGAVVGIGMKRVDREPSRLRFIAKMNHRRGRETRRRLKAMKEPPS